MVDGHISVDRGARIGVVGATGAVGQELLSLLEERNFPVGELLPFASERSRGRPISFRGRQYPCRILETGCFGGVEMAFFDASDSISKEWVPQAAAAGDNEKAKQVLRKEVKAKKLDRILLIAKRQAETKQGEAQAQPGVRPVFEGDNL